MSLFYSLADWLNQAVHYCGGEWLHSKHKCNLFLLIDETSFEAGIKVQIHTQNEPPFIDQLGFGVAPGFQTFVSCQEQRVSLANAISMLCLIYDKYHILPGAACISRSLKRQRFNCWIAWSLNEVMEGSYHHGYLILNDNNGREHVNGGEVERASGPRP